MPRKIGGSLWLCLCVVSVMPAGCGKGREGEQASRAKAASSSPSAPESGYAGTAAGPPGPPVAYGDLAEHAPPAAVEMVPRTPPAAATHQPSAPARNAQNARHGAGTTWPQAVATIADGSTLKIHCLPSGALPPGLGPAPAGRQYLVLDLIVENLARKGVALRMTRQFRLQDVAGHLYSPMPDALRRGSTPTRWNVLPAGGVRRLQLLYLVPAGQPMRFVYHGFEKTESVDLGQAGRER